MAFNDHNEAPMLTRNPRITAAGLALFTNQAPGFSLAVTHVALGSAIYNPTGEETALHGEFARFPIASGVVVSPSQIQVGVLVTNADPQARTPNNKHIGEIGFYVGATLLAVLSQGDRALFYKSPDLDVPISYILDFSTLPPNSLTVNAPAMTESLILASQTANAAALAAQGALKTITTSYYGAYAAGPGTRPDGSPPRQGDRYFDTTLIAEMTWNGNTWYNPNIDKSALAGPAGSNLVGYGATSIRAAVDNAHYNTRLRGGERAMIIAHRGFDLTHPQNTMLAFSSAIIAGADGIELDISYSVDGVAYVFHDETVDALTTGTGQFVTLTSEYIDTLRFDSLAGTPFADEPIPRFADVLALCREMGVPVIAELKQTSGNGADQIARVVSQIVAADMLGMVSLQTGYLPNTANFRALNAGLNVGFITADPAYAAYVDTLAALGNATVTISHDTVFANPGIVDYCAQKGVDLMVYTIPDVMYQNRVAKLGVTKFICSRYTRGNR